jgi:hypothetical protein
MVRLGDVEHPVDGNQRVGGLIRLEVGGVDQVCRMGLHEGADVGDLARRPIRVDLKDRIRNVRHPM